MMQRAAARSRFFLYLACAFLGIAIAGFSTTFFMPLARGTFSAPPIIHIHGALLFGWLILLILQSSLINQRRFVTHRQLGWLGAALCLSIVISGVLVGLHATRGVRIPGSPANTSRVSRASSSSRLARRGSHFKM